MKTEESASKDEMYAEMFNVPEPESFLTEIKYLAIGCVALGIYAVAVSFFFG